MESRLRRPVLTGLVIGIVATIVVGALLAFLLFPLVLKHRTSSPLEDRLGTNRVLAAIPAGYRRMANPLPSSSENVSSGQGSYTGNCLVCHGPTGTGDSPIGSSMYPPAADLLSPRVENMTSGEIFWIAKYGLSFVGMPSFRTLLGDEQIWQVEHYIRSLQRGGGGPGPGGMGAAPAPAGAAVAPAGAAAAAFSAADAGRARQIFAEAGCASCHGADAQGGVGPRLAGTRRSYELVLKQVRSGGPAMPPFTTQMMPDDEVKLLYEWFTSSR
jgi:mono/diheme cytochrome c family protein